jgi:hypothetical protein
MREPGIRLSHEIRGSGKRRGSGRLALLIHPAIIAKAGERKLAG